MYQEHKDEFCTMNELSKRWRVSRPTAERQALQRGLIVHRYGAALLVERKALEAYDAKAKIRQAA